MESGRERKKIVREGQRGREKDVKWRQEWRERMRGKKKEGTVNVRRGIRRVKIVEISGVGRGVGVEYPVEFH
eukprot:1217244-Amorphochlora_amoeboformis.AAC.1